LSPPLLGLFRADFGSQCIPPTVTLASICANIRGGAVERINFRVGSPVAHVYFISAEEATNYVQLCRAQGGVYWAGANRAVSTVDEIPASKGGYRPVRAAIARRIREEGATRCLRVWNLPNTVGVGLLMDQLRDQSRGAAEQVEGLQFVPEPGGSTFSAFLRMASIAAAIAAREKLQRFRYYVGCTYQFIPDPTEGSLDDLACRWSRERFAEMVAATYTYPIGAMRRGAS
jgi:hypothetical protein